MKVVKVSKKPTVSEVIEVTKNELLQLARQNNALSIGESDKKWLIYFKGDEHVGYVAGDIQYLLAPEDRLLPTKVPDLWFINKDYFVEHYTKKDK